MESPKITWQIKKKKDSSYKEETDYFAGVYNQKNNIDLEIVLWNNRYGLERVEDLKSFAISVTFNTLEDSTLLKYTTLTFNKNIIHPTINECVATFIVPDDCVLSGEINDGSLDAVDNYAYIELSISVPSVYTLKPNDYKTLSLDVINI